METYKIEITIDNLDFASYTGIMSTLKHMIENSKHEIKVRDGKNVDTSERQLTIPDVIKSVCDCAIPIEKTFSDKCQICGKTLKRYSQTVL